MRSLGWPGLPRSSCPPVWVCEGVLVLLLGGTLGAPAILGVAVVHRVFMTIGDLAMLAFTARARSTVLGVPDVTYVTRKFPPSVGGMETLAENTVRALWAHKEPGVIALGKRNVHLLWWIPATALRLVAGVLGRRSRSYLFGDALAWALLGWIPRLGRVPAFTMVCGLDITYRNRLYRAVVHRALRTAPRVLAISRATLETAIDAGVNRDRAHVLTMGLDSLAAPLELTAGRARLTLR